MRHMSNRLTLKTHLHMDDYLNIIFDPPGVSPLTQQINKTQDNKQHCSFSIYGKRASLHTVRV